MGKTLEQNLADENKKEEMDKAKEAEIEVLDSQGRKLGNVISVEEPKKRAYTKKSIQSEPRFFRNDKDLNVLFFGINLLIMKSGKTNFMFTKAEINLMTPEVNYVLGYHFGELDRFKHHIALVTLFSAYAASRGINIGIEKVEKEEDDEAIKKDS